MEHIGVCVVVLSQDKQNILLGRRLNSYGQGSLGIPGGRIELDESLEKCGIREILEETGLKATHLEYIGVIREFQKEYNFIHFAFVCKEFEGEPVVEEPEKCESWEWYPLLSLPENIMKGHKSAIDLFLNPDMMLCDLT